MVLRMGRRVFQKEQITDLSIHLSLTHVYVYLKSGDIH